MGVRVIWKASVVEEATLRDQPWEVAFHLEVDEATDAAVLHDARVTAVVTAGDFSTLQEALYVGKPILGLPYSAEQVSLTLSLSSCMLDADDRTKYASGRV